LDYIALKKFTDSKSWIYKYKGNPTDWLDQETFICIKERYPMVNKEYSELAKYEYQKDLWNPIFRRGSWPPPFFAGDPAEAREVKSYPQI